jgi:plasmid stabilization system protein ParE
LKYSVIIQPSAAAEIDAAFVYLAANASPEVASRWFNTLEARLDTLSRMPRRCPIAPEDPYFEEEIRHLIMSPYRILFTVRPGRVDVLHVRHMAQRTLGEPDEPDPLDD